MSRRDRTALVLYGSETGNAQDMAEELGKLCQRLHFASAVKELGNVDLVGQTNDSSGIKRQRKRLNSFNSLMPLERTPPT